MNCWDTLTLQEIEMKRENCVFWETLLKSNY